MIGFETQLELFIIVIIAAFLGGIIGFEREIDGHSAGFRTHIFICATAAALISIGTAFIQSFSAASALANGGPSVQTDPLRIIEAIILGVSFVGSGVILKEEKEHRVKNLTTAASVLFTTIIGICVGIHLFFLSIGLTILALVVNYALLQVQIRMHPDLYEKKSLLGSLFHRKG